MISQGATQYTQGHLFIPGGGQQASEQVKPPPFRLFIWLLEIFFKFFIIKQFD